MKYQKITGVLLSVFFILSICFLGIKNGGVIISGIKNSFKTFEAEGDLTELQKNLNAVESSVKNDFSYKNRFADIYGVGLSVINKKIIGNFDFMKTEHGETMQFSLDSQIDTEGFIGEMSQLSEYLKKRNIPLLYVQNPERELTDGEREVSGYGAFYDEQMKIFEYLKNAGVDTIDLNKELPEKDSAYFDTDIHLRTEYEFLTAELLCRHLIDSYGLEIPEFQKVFDLNNYSISSYPFIGNTSRSSGRFLSGTDNFEIYHPKFPTEMNLYVYDDGTKKSGTFDKVCLNGREQNDNKDEYIYWVTDVLQYPKAYYEINNSVSGPRLLIIADSIMLRAMSFISLASENVTIIDPRSDDGSALNNALLLDYDAVIVYGCSSNFFNAGNIFSNAQEALSGLSQKEQQNTVSYHGMFLDKYNNVKPAQKGEIEIDRNAEAVSLVGWAVDSEAKSNLGGVYIKAGDNIIACKYGNKRQGVVDAYGEAGYLNSGFTVNFSASLLYDENGELLDSISFILVGHDGTDIYEPVEYKLK